MKNIAYFFALMICFSIHYNAKAQLANGSIAPDFTLSDINGNVHHLYDYLDQGKTVYLDFSAAHCPTCWNYHNTHALKTLYNEHGAMGTISQDAVVLFIELDANNGLNEFNGISGNTQGDWLAGTPYPFLNPEGADRQIITNYKVNFYPMIYGICPNKSIKFLGAQTASILYDYTTTCVTSAIEDEVFSNVKVYPNPAQNELFIAGIEKYAILRVNDIARKTIFVENLPKGETKIDISAIPTGFYFLDIEVDGAKKQLKWTKY
jgi:hypothetical protein